MNVRDMDLVKSIPMQASMFGVKNPGIPVDFDIPLDGTLSVAGFDVAVHTPGHSKVSLAAYQRYGLYGDALLTFQSDGLIYRAAITKNLSRQYEETFPLPSDTRILPGHGGNNYRR